MGRLLIVSNRLPVTVKLERGELLISRSDGGLASGLRTSHEHSDSMWIGWPGEVSRFDSVQRARIEKELLALRTVPVYLTQAEISRYYDGFSNGVLWPLFHYQMDKVQKDAWRNWQTYEEVNSRFARLLSEHCHSGDAVWVHDYHLALVPAMLRKRKHEASIGFFLHIPFPSSEVFRILPWRKEVLEGLLGADLIGFHTYSYLTHFTRAVKHVLGIDSDGEQLRYHGRVVRLGVFPLGVDAERLSDVAAQPQVLAEVENIRERSGDRKLLVGVDRLDYTKGLARRMLAVERLLEREPSLRRRIRFIQIVVPSREKVEEYESLRRQLDEVVGRINGAYATVTSVPVNYLYRAIPERELIALYSAADVALVTPLRDGMNLVAKEFVACRNDEDGVLVLSEFAGAAAEFSEALIVNPYDIDEVATSIREALTMPREERQTRMKALRRRVRANTSLDWYRSFVEALHLTDEGFPVAPRLSSEDEVAGLLDKISSTNRLLILLDYDGTLVPFFGEPHLAAPDDELLELIEMLAARPGTAVHVVSGRTRDTLEQWLGHLPIGLHAEHGFWSLTPGGSWTAAGEERTDWKKEALPILQRFTAATPGSFIEQKTAGVGWHYRMADPEFGFLHARELRAALERELGRWDVDLLAGDKVIELRARGIDKGTIVSRLMAQHGSGETVLAIGDDQTDEDMFAMLPSGSFSVHVGPQSSRAQHRLGDVSHVRDFLRSLATRSQTSKEDTSTKVARRVR